MAATVDLREVIDLMLTRLEQESETRNSNDDSFDAGRWAGIEETAGLVRSLLALPSVEIDAEAKQ